MNIANAERAERDRRRGDREAERERVDRGGGERADRRRRERLERAE